MALGLRSFGVRFELPWGALWNFWGALWMLWGALWNHLGCALDTTKFIHFTTKSDLGCALGVFGVRFGSPWGALWNVWGALWISWGALWSGFAPKTTSA